MKQIKNYHKATVLDLETDGFLDEVCKIYICGYRMHGQSETKVLWGDTEEHRIRAMLQWHIDNEIPMAGHNFKTYDVPVLEKLYNLDLSELMVIDTMTLSHYLNIDKQRHSLEALASDYDAGSKFAVDNKDWASLTKEQAINRVTSDVDINLAVYQDFLTRLEDMCSRSKEVIDDGSVGGKRVSEDEVIYLDSLVGITVEEHINRILTFLMFKSDVLALQEKTGWHVDVPYLEENIEKLEVLVKEAADALESVMPAIPKYAVRKQPAKPYKKNGELSASGANWGRLVELYKNTVVDERGTPLTRVRKTGEIEELVGYTPPNINGHQQVKDFLTSYGWKPQTFKYVRDEVAFDAWIKSKPKKGAEHWEWSAWKDSKPEDRGIPQIRAEGEDGKELCESVEELAEAVPEIRYLEEYSVIKHRLDSMKGMLSRVIGGKVKAGWHGLTNTLRVKHNAPCVNLPAANKKYALPIRGSLIAPEGYISAGSDLSNLENRVAHHFMIVHDPEYVATMLEPDYDGHILNALAANLITQKEFDDYKRGIKPQHVAEARQQGKTASYAAAYGGGAASIAAGAGVDIKIGEKLHKGYWDLNWSVKAVAEEQVVVKDKRGFSWLVNPVNGFCYSIRSEKDIWNTLCQGLGSYLFDCWVDKNLEKQKEKWGRCTQTAAFHKQHCGIKTY